jgi:hypothetical protein
MSASAPSVAESSRSHLLAAALPVSSTEGHLFDNEEWRAAFGDYSLRYEVSSSGRVRRSTPGRLTWAGRMIATSRDRKGYPTVGLFNGRSTRSVKIHRLVAAAFLGDRPPGFQVNHIDGDKTNNRVGNLAYVSPEENRAHAHRIGLLVGLRVPKKLNEQAVKAIRLLASRGTSLRLLARLHGVCHQTIREVVHRETWKHV